MILLKIPEAVMKSTCGVRLNEVYEELVDASLYSGGRIVSDMQYIKARRPSAIDVALVRRGVADRLCRAQDMLPGGYSLKIYDAWRPYSVQKSIYDEYYLKLSEMPENTGLDSESLHALATRFVSMPKKGEKLSYVHSSGGAVDLTIIDSNGNELDMGTGFDEFSELCATHALEAYPSSKAKENRRLLYTVMTEAGFTNYPEEWWHYDYGDLFWAAITGNDAVYSSIYDCQVQESKVL